jgi:hypothetical protein
MTCPQLSRLRNVFLAALLALVPLLLLVCSGCNSELGVAASAVTGEVDVKPVYSGFKGQKIAILVWADEGITADHPRITAEVANGLQDKLQQAIDAKVDVWKGTTFFDNSAVFSYQEAHPESQSDPAEQIALQFPITRLVYVEVQSLSLHPGESMDLSRGDIVADVKIIEVNDGKSKTAYENDNVSALFPADAPPEGLTGLNENEVYAKTLDALTTELGKLFVPHTSEEKDTGDDYQ